MNTRHKKIIEKVCSYYGCLIDDIYSKKLTSNITLAKKTIYWIFRQDGLTYHQIGKMLNKNHATVIWGVKNTPAKCKIFAMKLFDMSDKMINIDEIVNLLNMGYNEHLISKKINRDIKEVSDIVGECVDYKEIADYKNNTIKIEYFVKKY